MKAEQVYAAATVAARKFGVDRITRDIVAVTAGCSPALVSHYCGTMEDLKRVTVDEAIQAKDLQIIAFVLGNREYKIPAKLRAAAAQHLAR